MLSSPLLALATLFFVTSNAFAMPKPIPTAGQSIPLQRRSLSHRSVDDWGIWAKNHRDMLMTKYGASRPQKRSSGTNLITNQNADSSFFGSLAIGTPPVSFNVILDTGSADLWVADSNCITGCDSVPTFDSSTSSTFNNKSTSFSITYGTGEAAGTLGTDTVQMAGFSVSNQVFAVCNQVSSGLLTNPVSGLLGLAFQSLAASNAVPFWQALVTGGAWDAPLMSFQLSRYVNDTSSQALEPGGTFTMGFVNSSLYTGDIDFVDIPAGAETYWTLPLTSLTVQGNSITLPTGTDAYSAIDTGTTLIGGPAQSISAIYAQVPGSAPGSGNLEGYYTFPCDTTVTVTLSFGGKSWALSPADFQHGQLTRNTCLGAFFELSTGSTAPSWIIGDTFLKNVYSVFRFDPPSVGFAQLSDSVLALNGIDGLPPTATIGSVAAAVSATGGISRVSNDATSSSAFVSMTIAGMTSILAVCLL